MTGDRFLSRRFLQHLLFWLAYFIFNLLIALDPGIAFWKTWLWALAMLPFSMALVYFHLYVIIPEFLLKGRYVLFFTIFIIVAVGFVLFARYLNYLILYPLFLNHMPGSSFRFFNLVALSYSAMYQYSVVFLAIIIRSLKQWYKSQQRSHELELQNKLGEIALLRMQINPHFLFNTLNNIHALISIDREKAADALVMLSDIMRYMLYDASADRVPLDQEIQYLESYIVLQKMRLADPTQVSFSVEGSTGGRSIAPVILIPFVENAFKYSSREPLSKGIRFRLHTRDRSTVFEAENPCRKGNMGDSSEHTGLGLVNVKRRLELLYPGRHRLYIATENGEFRIHLEIEDRTVSGNE